MRILITGGAGFIGSHLVDKLMQRGREYEIVVIDNLSAGRKEFILPYLELEQKEQKRDFRFYHVDLLHGDISHLFEGIDEVWHLAANPEVRIGAQDTRVHLQQNVIVTYNVLEAMRAKKIKKMIFTSTSTVYGEAKKIPTPENHPTMSISLYGASKLACEALISSYCHTFDMHALVYRFANVIGKRSTHGVIYDFIQKLRRNPHELEILGDGSQTKSYIYIEDCVNAMFLEQEEDKNEDRMRIFNIGTEDMISVQRIAEIVCAEMDVSPRFRFTGGKRGWKGDVPTMLLDVSRLKKLGFLPRYNSEEAVRRATQDLLCGTFSFFERAKPFHCFQQCQKENLY